MLNFIFPIYLSFFINSVFIYRNLTEQKSVFWRCFWQPLSGMNAKKNRGYYKLMCPISSQNLGALVITAILYYNHTTLFFTFQTIFNTFFNILNKTYCETYCDLVK